VQRDRLTRALREGRLRAVQSEDILDPRRIASLAAESAWLLLASGAGFAALDLVARRVNPTPSLLGAAPGWGALGLIAANIAAYLAMVPVHEGLHALAIISLGGRPRFGVRFPWAAYCTAPEQLFTRNGYLMVALTPLVALSAAGMAITWLAPNLGAFLWFGFAGNVAGAVGDLVVARHVRTLSAGILVADTETGYIAYAPVESGESGTSALPSPREG
jgi:hypothetical protein